MADFRIFLAGVNFSILPARKVENILFNVVDDGRDSKAINKTKQLITFAKTDRTMLDSSGFQILQAELQGKQITFDPGLPAIKTKERLNLSPVHVIEAACNIQPDILVGLDYPIRKLKEEDQEREYRFKSEFNARWARETATLRQTRCPHIQFFLPIQCYTTKQFEHYMTLIEGVHYDGFSMPIRNLTIIDVALFLIRFYQLGVQKVHLLGTTSFPMIALSSYFARHFFQSVSLDATTWRLAAKHNLYMNPLNLFNINLMGDSSTLTSFKVVCQCPFCSNRSFKYFKQLTYSERTALVRSHNWYATETIAKDLYDNATNIFTFETFLRSRTHKVGAHKGTCRMLIGNRRLPGC